MLRQLAVKTSPSSLARQQLHKRAFHSPFAFLTRSTPSASTKAAGTDAPIASTASYEKQVDTRPDPVGPAGARTYVVDAPNPADAPYAVPSGAYPVAAPFAH